MHSAVIKVGDKSFELKGTPLQIKQQALSLISFPSSQAMQDFLDKLDIKDNKTQPAK